MLFFLDHLRILTCFICILDRQWLELDLGPPTVVTGLVTRGRGDKKHWVTSYSVSYSNDSNVWFYYKDANHLEAKVDNTDLQQYHVSCVAKQISSTLCANQAWAIYKSHFRAL